MNVAIIGGSITEGAGASCYENTYANKLEGYLIERYNKIEMINLGAGGTASNFALFRLKRDLNDFKPDIIFVEFAVNDRIFNSQDSSIYFEGLIRECLKYTTKIIIIGMPTGMSDACVSIHKRIAYFYKIPVIDVQDAVWRLIGNREITWNKISIDNLHPNDKGHQLYFDIIKEELEKIDIEKIDIKMDYKVNSRYKFVNPILVEHSDERISYYGNWKEESYKLNNKFDLGAISYNKGDGVIFRFEGKYLAMMNLLRRDSGRLICTLDEKYTFYIDLYNDSDGRFDTSIDIKNLENKEHILEMVIDKESNPKSSGSKVIIGGFLIDPYNRK